MTGIGLLWRALRAGRRWWWASARPSTGAQLAGTGPARTASETGRSPTPDERWSPATIPSGPWSQVDPLTAPAWRGRAAHVVVGLWGAAVAWKVRGDWRGSSPPRPDVRGDARTRDAAR